MNSKIIRKCSVIATGEMAKKVTLNNILYFNKIKKL